MRIVGVVAGLFLVGCTSIETHVDVGDAGSDTADAAIDAPCDGSAYASLCQGYWPGYTKGYACQVDAPGCAVFSQSGGVTCCP